MQTGGVTGGDKRRDSQDRRCNIYAKIREEASGGIVTVCSGKRRHRHLYTTVSSSVEIRIINTGDSGDESAYFLIHFQGLLFDTFLMMQVGYMLQSVS